MSKIITLLCSFLLINICFGQKKEHKFVKLIKQEEGKRIAFSVKNNDSLPYSVFLLITSGNFRKSSKRPVLKTIPPNSEQHLLTLIRLDNNKSDFNYEFIVNQVSRSLSFRKDDEGININFDKALKSENIVIYESANCDLCTETKSLLKNYKIAFSTININDQLTELASELKLPEAEIKSKKIIIRIDGALHSSLTSKKDVIDVLKE